MVKVHTLKIGQFVNVDRFSHLFREGFWVILGQGIVIVSSIVGIRVLTELLDPQAYGELALGMTVGSIIHLTILAPIGLGASRFYAPALEQNDLRGYLNAVLQSAIFATVIAILMAVFILLGLVATGYQKWVGLVLASLIFVVFSGYNGIFNGIQNAARRRSVVALHQGVEICGRFLVAVALILLIGASSIVAMVGYAISSILVVISQYMFFQKFLQSKVICLDKTKIWMKEIWKYSWPFAAWGIFAWTQQASDRWALKLFTNTGQVGLYAVLFQLGYYPISLATGIVMNFLSPILYQRAGDATDGQRTSYVNNLSWNLTWLTVAVTICVMLIAFLFHTPIFNILVSKEYRLVSHLLPWMLLAGGLFSAGQTLGLNLMSQMKTHMMVPVKIATGMLGIVLNFAGAYYLGVTGVVLGGVLFSLLFFIWMMVLVKSVFRIGV